MVADVVAVVVVEFVPGFDGADAVVDVPGGLVGVASAKVREVVHQDVRCGRSGVVGGSAGASICG